MMSIFVDDIKRRIAKDILEYLNEKERELFKEDTSIPDFILNRERYLNAVIYSSMSIIPITGDWGMGKTTLGMVIYKKVKNIGTSYVSYIPLKIAFQSLKDKINDFYATSTEVFKDVKEPSRQFVKVVVPLIFSPNHIIENYGLKEKIYTSLPKDIELSPKDYSERLYNIATNFAKKLDKQYIIIFDEVESIQEYFDPKYFGPIFQIARDVFDEVKNNRLVEVFLVASAASPSFVRAIENVKTEEEYSRAYGVISPLITLYGMTNEELRELIRRYLTHMLVRKDKVFEKIEDIMIKYLKLIGPKNVRLTSSLIKEQLSQLLGEIAFNVLTDSLTVVKTKEELINLIRKNSERIYEEIEKSKNIEKSLQLGEFIEAINNYKFSVFKPYLKDIIYQFSSELAKRLKDEKINASEPSLLSKERGYLSYQIIIKERKPIRIVTWLRFNRIYKVPSREVLLQKLGLAEKSKKAETSPSEEKYVDKILLLYYNIKGGLIHKVIPELIIPVELNTEDFLSLLYNANIRSGGIERLLEELDQHFKHNLLPKITNIIKDSLRI